MMKRGRMTKWIGVLMVVACLSSDGRAQEARLLADINKQGKHLELPSALQCAYAMRTYYWDSSTDLWGQCRWPQLGDLVFFAVEEPVYGNELWCADVRSGKTRLVADLLPGWRRSAPRDLTVSAGLLFFVADDGKHGRELWCTDGTSQGTRLVKDISAGHVDSRISHVCPWPGGVAFVLMLSDQHHEMWVSDGTLVGTKRIHTENQAKYSGISGLTWNPFQKRLWAANQSGDIWTWDPTMSLAAKLKGQVQSTVVFPRHPVAVFDKNRAYYLRQIQGRNAGTLIARDYATGKETELTKFESYGLGSSAFLGGRLVFWRGQYQVASELWSTDGSVAGTALLCTGTFYPGTGLQQEQALWRGTWVFGRVKNQIELEFWQTDGTAAGTRPLGQQVPRQYAGVRFAVEGDQLFVALDGINEVDSIRRWTATGWQDVRVDGPKEIYAGASGLTPTGRGSMLFGWGDQGLWQGPAGVGADVCLYDLRSSKYTVSSHWDHPSNSAGSDPGEFTALRGELFFVADDGLNGEQVWRYDFGKKKATIVRGPELAPDAKPDRLTVAGGRLFFSAVSQSWGRELFVWDEATQLARMVRDIDPGGGSGILPLSLGFDGKTHSVFREWKGMLVFSANDGKHGRELWMSDGSAAGTRMLFDLETVQGHGVEFECGEVIGDRIVFLGRSTLKGDGLWAYDGDKSQLVQLLTLPRDWRPEFQQSVRVGDRALFMVPTGGVTNPSVTLVSTDGTRAGTFVLDQSKERYPVWGAAEGPLCLHSNGERAWAVMMPVVAGGERLWESDGRSLLRDLYQAVPGLARIDYPASVLTCADGLVLGWKNQVVRGAKLETFARTGAVPTFGFGGAITPLGAGRQLLGGFSQFVRERATGHVTRILEGGSLSVPPEPTHVSGHVVFQSDAVSAMGAELWAIRMQTAAHAVGGSCGARPLRLDCSDPVQGKSSVLRLRYSGAYAASVLYFGTEARARTPLFGHCVAQFDALGFHLPIALWASNANGEAFDALPIPQDPAFTGQHFVLQAVSMDTQGKVSTSNGVLLVPGRG